MSKGYYTYSTKGNVTTVHYHGPPGKSIARFGPEIPLSQYPAPQRPTEAGQDRAAATDQDKAKSKKKRKKKDQ